MIEPHFPQPTEARSRVVIVDDGRRLRTTVTAVAGDPADLDALTADALRQIQAARDLAARLVPLAPAEVVLAEIVAALDHDRRPRTAHEIAREIHARTNDVTAALESRCDLFEAVTGDQAAALGRRVTARLWRLAAAARAEDDPDRPIDFGRSAA